MSAQDFLDMVTRAGGQVGGMSTADIADANAASTASCEKACMCEGVRNCMDLAEKQVCKTFICIAGDPEPSCYCYK